MDALFESLQETLPFSTLSALVSNGFDNIESLKMLDLQTIESLRIKNGFIILGVI